MIAAIGHWWNDLSMRERWLIGVAGALAAAVIGWFLIFMPLQRSLRDAHEALGAAIDRRTAVSTRVAAIRRLEAAGGHPSAATGDTASLDLRVAQSAAEAGFTLSRNETQGGGVSIAIANARARTLLVWLDTLEQSGLVADELSLRPNADGTVALSAVLRPSR
jgi:general secretion pathway protein M